MYLHHPQLIHRNNHLPPHHPLHPTMQHKQDGTVKYQQSHAKENSARKCLTYIYAHICAGTMVTNNSGYYAIFLDVNFSAK